MIVYLIPQSANCTSGTPDITVVEMDAAIVTDDTPSSTSTTSLTSNYTPIIAGALSSMSATLVSPIWEAYLLMSSASSLSLARVSETPLLPQAAFSISDGVFQYTLSSETCATVSDSSGVLNNNVTPSTITTTVSDSSLIFAKTAELISAIAAFSNSTFTIYKSTLLDSCTPEVPTSDSTATLAKAIALVATITTISNSTLLWKSKLPYHTAAIVSNTTATIDMRIIVQVTMRQTGSMITSLLPMLTASPVSLGGISSVISSVPTGLLVKGLNCFGRGTVSGVGLPLIPRTVTVTGRLGSAQAFGLQYATVRAELVASLQDSTRGAVSVAYTTIETQTDSFGNWILKLIPPQDLSSVVIPGTPAPYYTIYIDADGPSPVIVQTTSFYYTSGTESISNILQQTTYVPMRGFCYSLYGKPIIGQRIVAQINQSATDSLTTNSISATDEFISITDQEGQYVLSVPPTNRILPTGSYFIVYETNNAIKQFTVPSIGGFINSNLYNNLNPTTIGLGYDHVGPDTNELSTNDTITISSNLTNSLDRIRYVYTQIFGQSWPTIQATAQIGLFINPPQPQSGSVAITGNITATQIRADSVGSNQLPSIIANNNGFSNLTNAAVHVANAGTSATFNNTVISHNINSPFTFFTDMYGVILWSSGTDSWLSGPQIFYTFINAYTNNASIKISPLDGPTALAMANIYAIINLTGFTINFVAADTTAHSYKISYQIKGV